MSELDADRNRALESGKDILMGAIGEYVKISLVSLSPIYTYEQREGMRREARDSILAIIDVLLSSARPEPGSITLSPHAVERLKTALSRYDHYRCPTGVEPVYPPDIEFFKGVLELE